ncbi:MAG: hypothetical protein ACFFAA_04210 [Promethearchaeota archaeon]
MDKRNEFIRKSLLLSLRLPSKGGDLPFVCRFVEPYREELLPH